jgi:diaminopimelate epimerase
VSGRDGRDFFKMTGSGNDFVFFDAMAEPVGDLDRPERVRALCARGTGVGADGVVILEPAEDADFRIRYYNSDGSRASLCGNASLCTVRLAVELGIAGEESLAFGTDAGVIQGRIRAGLPEIDLQPVANLRDDTGLARGGDERLVGFVVAGVPHAVVLVGDVEAADVVGRGRELRWDGSFRDGANVNFVSGPDGRSAWAIRTFERGVEGETLACGTGAVATAVLLSVWGLAGGPEVELATRSGQSVYVRPAGVAGGRPSLRGEGRLVYRGRLSEV